MKQVFSESDVIASIDGLSVTQLQAFVSARCVVPKETEAGPTYAEVDLARLRLLAELTADFDLDDDAAALVLSLLDQIHGLRRQLRALAQALAKEPEDVRARLRADLSRYW